MSNYEEFWKDIVENEDGSLNKEQVMKELSDYSMLIDHLTKLYCLVTGNTVSNPCVKPEAVYELFADQLQEAYDRGYDDGIMEVDEGVW